ncbi:hypothetical protein Tco_1384896 [Tanacetum coccineum]
MKVCDMIEKGKWKWKQWKKKFNAVNSIPVPTLKPNSPDTTLWTTKKGVEGKFSINKAGNDIRDDKETVKWWNLVCYEWESLVDQASKWPSNKSVMSMIRRIMSQLPDRALDGIRVRRRDFIEHLKYKA